MGKKNIDKLFQEKFEGFNEMPDEKVWNSISESLDKKKSRKVIPFWWKLSGVAALLAILFMAINPFGDENNVPPIISDTEQKEKDNPAAIEDEVDPLKKEASSKTIQLVDTDANESDNSNSEDISKTETSIKSADTQKSKNREVERQQLATVDAKTSNQNEAENDKAKSAVISNDIIKSKESVAYSEELAVDTERGERIEDGQSEKKIDLENSTTEVLAQVVNEEEEKNEVAQEDGQEKSIFEEIEKKTKEEALAENSKNKWSIGANLAPVYFSSFGEGSPIDPAFNTNSKSGEVNMSYGLSIAYNVTEKLSVRTGVNKVDFGYDTNEVEFSASLQGSLSSRLNNVNYSESAENVVVGSKADNGFAFAERSSDVLSNDISRNGVMAQEFGYIEVPVELDYAIVDSRFGVNLIGGVSTLFLTNNSVVLNDSNETIELGEANNLNNVNFSTNVGFGLNYKFSQKIRMNVEPVFKYQLGTFSDTSGSFNPFSIGVYSGLNFKF